MLAIQDEVMATKNYKKHVMKKRTVLDDKCRLCGQKVENIQHITSGCVKLAGNIQHKTLGCVKLAGNDYLHRHDQVTKIIYQKLARKVGLIKDTVPYYKYDLSTILANDEHKIYWNRTLHTDKTVRHNRSDIVLVNVKDNISDRCSGT